MYSNCNHLLILHMWLLFTCIKEMDYHSALNDSPMINPELEECGGGPNTVKGNCT